MAFNSFSSYRDKHFSCYCAFFFATERFGDSWSRGEIKNCGGRKFERQGKQVEKCGKVCKMENDLEEVGKKGSFGLSMNDVMIEGEYIPWLKGEGVLKLINKYEVI